MSVGFIMLVHTALERSAQVARHLAEAGCPVVIHVDRRVSGKDHRRLVAILRGYDQIRFCQQFSCEWGTWSIVKATKAASTMMLREFPEAQHVFLTSGTCLPLRPIRELVRYLQEWPDTDFIESVTTSEVPWTLGGLEEERFTLYFPVGWKKRRTLFDRLVALQRGVGINRKAPKDVIPHLGSQWWCLTRRTLGRILNDPDRSRYERYFRTVWIPDEAYFQSLVRLHSERIESRSLTLSKFDYQGRPHIFYDDHLELLRRSDCFFARKVWPKADRLYQNFLALEPAAGTVTEPNPGKIDRLFSRAIDRRTRGRDGLVMQSRFPRAAESETAWPYSVFQGYSQVFDGFENWLSRATSTPVHGRLFHPDRIEFADSAQDFKGGLTTDIRLRDYHSADFLRNLIWNTRGERQFFQYGPEDSLDVWNLILNDPNAQVSLVTGAWAISVYRANLPFEETRKLAARLQRLEQSQVEAASRRDVKAKVRVQSLSDYLANPIEPLQVIIDEATSNGTSYLGEAPRLTRLDGFAEFLQSLRNAGMRPYLAGNFPIAMPEARREARRQALDIVRS